MIRRLCLVLGLVTLCASVNAKPKPLPVPLAPALPVEVVPGQHELAVEVPDTAMNVGAQFGLLGALVGSAVQNAQVKAAEAAVVPLRNLLIDYPFNARIEAAVRAKLASDGISPAPIVTMLDAPWDSNNPKQDRTAMPAHALVLVPRYAIDHKFNELIVMLTAQLVDRTPKSNGRFKTKLQFSQVYGFHFPLTVSGKDDENLKRWESIGTPRIMAMLDVGVQNVVDMLVYDFSAEGRDQWDQKQPSHEVLIKGLRYTGMPVRQTEDYVWMRTGMRMARSVHGYFPVLETAAMPAPATVSAAVDMPAAAPTAQAPDTAATAVAPAPAEAPAAADAPGGR